MTDYAGLVKMLLFRSIDDPFFREAATAIEELQLEVDTIKQVEFPRRIEKVTADWRARAEKAEAELAHLRQTLRDIHVWSNAHVRKIVDEALNPGSTLCESCPTPHRCAQVGNCGIPIRKRPALDPGSETR